MSKHTPGPWLAVPDGSNWNVVVPAQSGFDHFVVGNEGLYRCDGSDEANARLIAAAPDMLAALKGLFAHTRICALRIDQNPIEDARAAIAKAEGA